MSKLLGVVLCGGESKRMGSDKGLMTKDGDTWAGLVAVKLRGLNIPVIFSINQNQTESYSSHFSPGQLVVDDIDIAGPLKGLLSTHARYPDDDILLMACDLIDMNQDTLVNLINQYRNNPGFDFFAYHHEYLEPFCAIYTVAGLVPILERAQAHSLEKFSFQTVLREGKTFRIPITDREDFKNYNTIPGHHKEV